MSENKGKLSILAVSNLYPPFHAGGYGQLCFSLCEGLAAHGHQVRVLTAKGEGARSTNDSAGTLEVARELSPISRSDSVLTLIQKTVANRNAVRAAIERWKPDVIYCHGIDGVGYQTYHTAVESGVPSLTSLGDSWLAQAWSRMQRFDYWASIGTGGTKPGIGRIPKLAIGAIGRMAGLYCGKKPLHFRSCTAISEYLVEDLAEACPLSKGLVPVVPPLIGEGFFDQSGSPVGRSGNRTSGLRALFVGRMELLKGPDTAIRAVASAVSLGADVSLTFAGMRQEELRPELEVLAKSLGVEKRIIWAGTPIVSELVQLFRSHDVFLFPSRIVEGFGLVNAEAMACGLPVIGAAHSGSADIIIDGETGYRVAAEDASEIGRYLSLLQSDRDLLEKLSIQARQRAERHSPARVIGDVEGALRRAIRQN